MVQILVFGDSIVYGAWDKEGGWVSRLRRFLDEKSIADPKFYCLLYNLGISGDTAEDILGRFESETKQRLKEGEETILIFSVGVNDSKFIHSTKSLRYTSKQFRANILKIIKHARKFSEKIVFVGLTPVDEAKTTPILWNAESIFKNEHIRQNNEIVKSVCMENDVAFIDIFDTLMKAGHTGLLEDGVHPNSAGHQKISEMVKKFLIEKKVI